MMTLKEFANAKAIELGKDVLRMTAASGSGHPSSGLSIMHIVVTLMQDVMRWDPADPWNPGNDRLVLSEGHAVPAVYAVYADMAGVVGSNPANTRKLTKADLSTLRETHSVLDGHPNPAEGFPFFDAATGSLGQGLSVGAGLGVAARLAKSDKQIYVLIGDGESREGQIWEAMDFIADHGLFNVIPIFNCNGQGQADYVSRQQSAEMIAGKAEAFGFAAIIIDGHDADAFKAALGDAANRRAPLAIIARTHKGWGCASLKDVSNHGKPLGAAQLDKGIADLDATAAELKITVGAASRIPAKPQSITRPAKKPIAIPPFAEGMAAAGLGSLVEKNAVATRRAYGAALLALGAADERITALDGDVRNSTFSEMFYKKYPARFVECKIAEQNMVSVAAGMAAAGHIPFASSFAKFLARAYDQVEMAMITRANIKLVGSHAGVSLAADGPSQMSLQDVAYFRSASMTDARGFLERDSKSNTPSSKAPAKPVCVSLQPADAVAAYHLTALMANHDGLCYMRTHRPDIGLLYKPETRFEIGGSHVLMEGNALTLVSTGYMVHECKKAAEMLAKDGVKVTLIDAYSLPLDTKPIFAAAAKTNSRILVVEDNYLGGLAGAIAEDAAEQGDIRVASMTCRTMPKSAKSTEDILTYVGLSSKDIMARVKSLIG
ncbi:MAG: transketolase [Planctomycetes bacterium]|nr:transketolase [Planctomycetota bacterium]